MVAHGKEMVLSWLMEQTRVILLWAILAYPNRKPHALHAVCSACFQILADRAVDCRKAGRQPWAV